MQVNPQLKAVKESRSLFPETSRVVYRTNPLIEVVTQLRFPRIMTIAVDIPARFQEEIRKTFPVAQVQRTIGFALAPSSVSMAEQAKLSYEFLTLDKKFKLTLCDEFVSLTTSSYRRWEEFHSYLRVGVEAFLKVYEPAYFERVGLRYVDLIDRARLNLVEQPWSDLVRPQLLGVLGDREVDANTVTGAATNFVRIVDGVCCSMSCGYPNEAIVSEEARKSFGERNLMVIDTDFFNVSEMVRADDALRLVAAYNKQVRNAFRWAIRPRLHEALGPEAP